MNIEFEKLDYKFKYKPLLIGGKASEPLRKIQDALVEDYINNTN